MLLRCAFRSLASFVTGLIFGALFLGCARRAAPWRESRRPAPESSPPDIDAAPL